MAEGRQGFAAVGALLGGIAAIIMMHIIAVPLHKLEWQCTASEVINETLPREEECTQYTREDIKP